MAGDTTDTTEKREPHTREPNTRLLDAREARRMTQQQVAEAADQAHWRLFGKASAIDGEYVSKLERGVITWPNSRYRAAFRHVLGADTDAELGFYYHRRATTVERSHNTGGRTFGRTREVSTSRRDQFLRLIGALTAGACVGTAEFSADLPDPVREVLTRAAEHADTPVRVGRTDIEQLRLATQTFRDWREKYGGGAIRDALAGQVRWAAGLLRGHAEDDIRRELHSAVGSLADMAGWNDVDAGYHDTALRSFHLALYCAGQAHDWTLRAEILTDMSQQAVDLGLFDEATSLVELAQVRADRVAGTGRAMMCCAHARILGMAGRITECRAAVAAAEDHFGDQLPIDDLPAASYFQQAPVAYLALDSGHALFQPGLTDPTTARAARERLLVALGHGNQIVPRRRAMGTAKLATLQLLHGDRDEGIAVAHQAIDLADGMRSARLTEDLRRLRTATTTHAITLIGPLQHRLDLLLRSA